MRGYDYDRGFRGRRREPLPPPQLGWLPGAYMGQMPMNGWGWWGGPLDWPPYPRLRGRYDDSMRRWGPVDPRQSATYGRGGDLAARRWAERYGYDMEVTIRPERGYGREGGDGPVRGFSRRR